LHVQNRILRKLDVGRKEGGREGGRKGGREGGRREGGRGRVGGRVGGREGEGGSCYTLMDSSRNTKAVSLWTFFLLKLEP
jgi:hypothetical protein